MKSFPRVVTLTLHPAIDRIVKIDAMRPGGTFDGSAQLTLPAGKGINTARVLGSLSGDATKIVAAAWAGENESHYFKTRLRELGGIDCAICPRAVPTRFAHTYLETDGRETHIKEAMSAPNAAESNAFLEFWRKIIRKGDIVAICGSAPKGTKPAFLKSVFSIAHERGASAIVADTNGPALDAAAISRIKILKGNAAEIGALLKLGASFNSADTSHCRQLLDALQRKSAPEKVLITLGSEGALLASSGKMLHCKVNPRHFDYKIISTTGCGDAATAGTLWSLLLADDNDESILLFAVACGAAKTLWADPGKISLKHFRLFVRYCLMNPIETP